MASSTALVETADGEIPTTSEDLKLPVSEEMDSSAVPLPPIHVERIETLSCFMEKLLEIQPSLNMVSPAYTIVESMMTECQSLLKLLQSSTDENVFYGLEHHMVSVFMLFSNFLSNPSDLEQLPAINDFLQLSAQRYRDRSFNAPYVLTPSRKHQRDSDSDDISGFSPVKKGAKMMTITPTSPIPTTENRFETLPAVGNPPSGTDTTAEANSANNQNPISAKKEEKPEAYFLQLSENWEEHRDAIFKAAGETLKMKFISGKFVKIFPKTVQQFRDIQTLVEQGNIPTYNANLKTERPKKVMLRNIPHTYSADQVKEDLFKKGYDIRRVIQITNSDPVTRIKIRQPLFQCYFSQETDFDKLYKDNEILGFYARFSEYRNDNPRQCYNCQNFGHSSETCRLPPRCVICAEAHSYTACPQKGNMDFKGKCCNCGGQHVASNKGCPQNPKNIRAARKAKNPTISDVQTKARSGQPIPTTFIHQQIAPPEMNCNSNFPTILPVAQTITFPAIQTPKDVQGPTYAGKLLPKRAPPASKKAPNAPAQMMPAEPAQTTVPTLAPRSAYANIDAVINKVATLVSYLRELDEISTRHGLNLMEIVKLDTSPLVGVQGKPSSSP